VDVIVRFSHLTASFGCGNITNWHLVVRLLVDRLKPEGPGNRLQSEMDGLRLIH
jgi:hypothetical protein